MAAVNCLNDRGQYPDALRARTPKGYRDKIRDAAARESISIAEFIRRAIRDRIEGVQAGQRVVSQSHSSPRFGQVE